MTRGRLRVTATCQGGRCGGACRERAAEERAAAKRRRPVGYTWRLWHESREKPKPMPTGPIYPHPTLGDYLTPAWKRLRAARLRGNGWHDKREDET